jgi:hypothetical protein
MSARHRRPKLPSADGRVMGVAVIAANLLGICGVTYVTEAATPAAHTSDLPSDDETSKRKESSNE